MGGRAKRRAERGRGHGVTPAALIVCLVENVTTFLAGAWRATPSQIGYVRIGVAGERTKLGVSYLPVLARLYPLARLWLQVAVGYGDTSLLPSGFPLDNIEDIILK